VKVNLVHQPFDFNYAGQNLKDIDVPNHLLESLNRFTEEELLLLRWRITWKQIAREKQLPPRSFQELQDMIWGVRSGRGFGKTLLASNWLGIEACLYSSYYAVIAPTSDDVRYTCFEGPTGLLACIPPQLIRDRSKSPPILYLWNGSIIRGFAGDSPERLRGPQHAKAWCDEIASWMYPDKAWSNLLFGLRLGPAPQILWTGTPKPTPFVRNLQNEPNSVVTIGSTYENRENLTDFFYQNIAKYEGTKVGRQELYGEVLDPEEEGFVKRSQWRMWPHDRPLPKFKFILMSLDTAFTEKTHDKKSQKADPSACSIWGYFLDDKGKKAAMLLDAWEDWLNLPQLIKKVKDEREYTYGDADEPIIKPRVGKYAPRHQGRAVDLILIEDKGSGISLRQSLAEEDIITHPYNPGRDDKLTRLHMVSPQFAAGRVYAVESEIIPGQFKTWAEPLITQVCSYIGEGSTERDDLLDTTTQAMLYLRDRFFDPITVKGDKHEQPARKRKEVNPYD
jgi:predicted phage terminase large subunit-like protein